MRFMMIFKPANTTDTEAGVPPSQDEIAEMGKFNEELVKSGVLLAAEGLQPSSKGARVRLSGGKLTVTDGPFTETKELIAGFCDRSGEVEGRGDRIGQALPQSWRAIRGRDRQVFALRTSHESRRAFGSAERAAEAPQNHEEIRRCDS